VSAGYHYRASVKSDASDELINTFLLRPAAGILVRLLYPTAVTPNQVTIAAILAGLLAAVLYFHGGSLAVGLAGATLTLKDLLDSADGQLARAKGKFSRAGRFLDSIGDIVVNFAVFAAIAATFLREGASGMVLLECAAAFLGVSLRVSYHVFYQTAFLHLASAYQENRLSEEIREEDLQSDRLTLRLQRIFLFLYGWQDAIMARLDRWCRGDVEPASAWYGDVTGVRLSGFLGMGTELMLLTVCSIAGRLDIYLTANIVGMNMVWGFAVGYRRFGLRSRLRTGR
jgi:phosphatidylglycerophosphate synthase